MHDRGFDLVKAITERARLGGRLGVNDVVLNRANLFVKFREARLQSVVVYRWHGFQLRHQHGNLRNQHHDQVVKQICQPV